MSDIYCAKCGEPWDAYGVYHCDDMDASEKKQFLRGEGCPACGFGRKLEKQDKESILQGFLRAAESEIEASDEDPISILTRRGLL